MAEVEEAPAAPVAVADDPESALEDEPLPSGLSVEEAAESVVVGDGLASAPLDPELLESLPAAADPSVAVLVAVLPESPLGDVGVGPAGEDSEGASPVPEESADEVGDGEEAPASLVAVADDPESVPEDESPDSELADEEAAEPVAVADVPDSAPLDPESPPGEESPDPEESAEEVGEAAAPESVLLAPELDSSPAAAVEEAVSAVLEPELESPDPEESADEVGDAAAPESVPLDPELDPSPVAAVEEAVSAVVEPEPESPPGEDPSESPDPELSADAVGEAAESVAAAVADAAVPDEPDAELPSSH